MEVNSHISELLDMDHCYRTQAMRVELCYEQMAEALGVERADWVTIFNHEWPEADKPRVEGRRMVATWFSSPQGDVPNLPVLRRWAQDYAFTPLAATLPGLRCNNIGYVLRTKRHRCISPTRTLCRECCPPSAHMFFVSGSVSCDTPGTAGVFFVPQ